MWSSKVLVTIVASRVLFLTSKLSFDYHDSLTRTRYYVEVCVLRFIFESVRTHDRSVLQWPFWLTDSSLGIPHWQSLCHDWTLESFEAVIERTIASACHVISSDYYACSVCWTGTVRVASDPDFHSCLKLSNFSIIVVTVIRACHENAYYLPHLSRRKYFNDRIPATIFVVRLYTTCIIASPFHCLFLTSTYNVTSSH